MQAQAPPPLLPDVQVLSSPPASSIYPATRAACLRNPHQPTTYGNPGLGNPASTPHHITVRTKAAARMQHMHPDPASRGQVGKPHPHIRISLAARPQLLHAPPPSPGPRPPQSSTGSPITGPAQRRRCPLAAPPPPACTPLPHAPSRRRWPHPGPHSSRRRRPWRTRTCESSGGDGGDAVE